MSSLICEITEVLEIQEHPNADKLELVKIKGWVCVAQIGLYKKGDKVIYAPIDSVLPTELSDAMGITNFLGSGGRVKTAKLRGYYSQGLIIPLKYLKNSEQYAIGTDVKEQLGITKYEPPINVSMSGSKLEKPPEVFYRYTDIENIKNFPDILERGEIVVITEKIHGTNFRALKLNGELYVGSHNIIFQKNAENLYWKAAIQADLENKLDEGKIIFGEVYGAKINNLRYDLDNSIAVKFFDLLNVVGNVGYVNRDEFTNYCETKELEIVPELFRGPWRSTLTGEISTKKSVLASHMMEGLVIGPVIERYDPRVGRVKLKHIREEFLTKQYGDRH